VGRQCCGKGSDCCLPGEICCEEQCGLTGACCIFATGACIETTAYCCLAQGGEYQGDGTVCSPSDLCMPKCDNCQTFSRTFGECYHENNWPNGTPCSTNLCIHTQILTASCVFHPDRIGPPHCDTRTDVTLPKYVQYYLVPPGGCPAQNLQWNTFFQQYVGCGTECNASPPFEEACVIPQCSGSIQTGPIFVMGKQVCGCSEP